MESREQRIYIGNLPKDVKLSHLIDVLPDGYDESQLEIRHNYDIDKNITSSYAFVNIVGTESDIRSWCSKASKKSLGGNVLQVQFAKLSFLERLRQEVNSQKPNKGSPNVPPASAVSKVPFVSSNKFNRKFDNVKSSSEPSSTESSSEDERPSVESHPVVLEHEEKSSIKNSTKAEDVLPKGEVTRRESLKQRESTYDNRQKMIRMSIKNVSKGPSNKIVFKDSDDELPTESKEDCSGGDGKKRLFDHSESENEEDFEFAEDKPKSKLIRTKVSAVDERFRMDSRFFDEEDSPSAKKAKNDSDTEQGNMLRIVDSIVGKDPNAKLKVRSKVDLDTVIPTRFNPLEKKHSSLIIKKDEDILLSEVGKKAAKPKPFKVEKERFYQVSDTLKEQFKSNENTGFSLLGLFGGDATVPKSETPSNNIVKNKTDDKKSKINILKNPLLDTGASNFFTIDDLSDIEETNQNKTNNPERGKMSWNEPLFPLLDDPRIEEALKFFSTPMEEKVSHAVIRRDLKNIVKKKYLKNMAKTKQFKTKLGNRRKLSNAHEGKKKKKKIEG